MIIPDGYAQANILLAGGSAPTGAEITMGFELNGFTGGPIDLADLVAQAFADEWLPFLVSTLTMTGCLVKFGPNATGPSAVSSITDTGSSGSAGVSPQVALLVQKNTALGGRAGRGRYFVPGIAESSVSAGGVIDSGAVTSYQTAADAFFAALNDGEQDPCLLHGVGSPLSTPTEITEFVVSAQCATQRRRNRR